FFLRNGGYYWAVNDYMDLTFQGDIYSRGSWGLNVGSSYRKLYLNNGGINLSYSVFQNGLGGLPTTTQSKNFFVVWNHTQDPKARPNSNFSASVNAGSQQNFQNNFNSSNTNYLTNTFKSNISYSKTFPGKPYMLTANASHSQNNLDTTQRVNFVLPELAFTMQ